MADATNNTILQNQTEKENFIFCLLKVKENIYAASTALRFKKRYDDANKLKKQGKSLAVDIDDLLGAMMLEWTADILSTIAEIDAASLELKGHIENIKQGIEVAENTVRAIGIIDDILEIAISVVGSFA